MAADDTAESNTSNTGGGPEGPPPVGRTVIRLDQITKRYGSVTACDSVDLELRAGKVHGVLGENGAGKSTLMKVIIGLVLPDEGVITIDGMRTELRDPIQAAQHGIGMVHQHFSLVEPLKVWENVALGDEGRLRPRARYATAWRRSPSATGSPWIPTPWSANFPSACVNGSRSSSACAEIRRSSSSTNRPRCSPPPRASNSSRRCTTSWSPKAERSRSSVTSSTRSSGRPTRSRSCARGASSSTSRLPASTPPVSPKQWWDGGSHCGPNASRSGWSTHRSRAPRFPTRTPKTHRSSSTSTPSHCVPATAGPCSTT